jgi:hypothetical protein
MCYIPAQFFRSAPFSALALILLSQCKCSRNADVASYAKGMQKYNFKVAMNLKPVCSAVLQLGVR